MFCQQIKFAKLRAAKFQLMKSANASQFLELSVAESQYVKSIGPSINISMGTTEDELNTFTYQSAWIVSKKLSQLIIKTRPKA